MIVVLPQLHGEPRVLQLERREVIELARVICDGPAEDQPAPATEPEAFVPAWARLRRVVRHARHFVNREAALHFYRFGNHGLRAAEAALIVRHLRVAPAGPQAARP